MRCQHRRHTGGRDRLTCAEGTMLRLATQLHCGCKADAAQLPFCLIAVCAGASGASSQREPERLWRGAAGKNWRPGLLCLLGCRTPREAWEGKG